MVRVRKNHAEQKKSSSQKHFPSVTAVIFFVSIPNPLKRILDSERDENYIGLQLVVFVVVCKNFFALRCFPRGVFKKKNSRR